LRFYAPGLAPREGDVFDFCPTRCESGATLFSVQSVPPTQSDAKLAALGAATGRAGAALALVLLLGFITAPAGRWRWLVTVAAAWSVARALQDSTRWGGLFSPASFYRPMLGGFSASAGALTALGVVLLLTAAAVWRRGIPRRWWSLAGAGVLVLAAPYVVRYFGRGITPPAGGVGFALWMSWEVAVATAAMALVFAAAALVRGGRDALGLGAAADPRAAALLQRLGAAPPTPPPRTAGDLYAWWLASPLAADSYPASLAVWHRSGEPAAEIRLASVDLPLSL